MGSSANQGSGWVQAVSMVSFMFRLFKSLPLSVLSLPPILPRFPGATAVSLASPPNCTVIAPGLATEEPVTSVPGAPASSRGCAQGDVCQPLGSWGEG